MSNLIPHLVVHDGAAALDFYAQALGAQIVDRHTTPDGAKVVHGVMLIEGATVFVCDDFGDMMGPCASRSPEALRGTSVTLTLSVPDADASHRRLVAAGGTSTMEVAEQFWGSRYGKAVDPFGHEWAFNTHVREVAPDEVKAASDRHFA